MSGPRCTACVVAKRANGVHFLQGHSTRVILFDEFLNLPLARIKPETKGIKHLQFTPGLRYPRDN